MASETHVPVARRELLACALALAIGIAVLPAVGGRVLWTHPLWLDELCCTIYPTEHATSPVAVITNLAHRQDLAPPLLHLIVWTVGRAAGGMTTVLLRNVALVSVSLALIFTYTALRRRFSVAASAAGAVAIAAHPLVITHAFEGRFYGPWLLCAAAYAWAVGRRDRTGAVLQGIFAMCLVTIHWFGIISLVIMATAVAVSFAPRWREGVVAVAPSAAGVAALLACAPLLVLQSKGSSAFAWIPPLSAAQLLGMARVFFLLTVPAVAVAILVADALRPGRNATFSRIAATLRQPSTAGLASLCAMPLALVVVSIVVQPSVLDRYAITTMLFWGPLVALAVESLTRELKVIAILALLFQFKPGVQVSIDTRQAFADQVAGDSVSLARVQFLGVPVAFPWLQSLYPVAAPHRDATTPVVMLDVPDSALQALYPGDRLAWFRARTRVEALSARSHLVVYGFPKVVTTADLDTVKRFAVMTSDLRVRGGARQAEVWAHIVFPHHAVLRLDDRVSLLIRK